MSFSTDEIEKLGILRELRDQGKVSDEEFREARVAILEGRPLAEDLFDRAAPPKREPNLGSLTSVPPSRRRLRQRHFERQQAELEKSQYAKTQREEDGLRSEERLFEREHHNEREHESTNLNESTSLRPHMDLRGGTNLPMPRQPQRQNHPPPRSGPPSIFIVVFLMFGAAIALTAVVSQSASLQQRKLPDIKALENAARIMPSEPVEAENQIANSPYIRPLFGEAAMRNCAERCDQRKGALINACRRGCFRLSLPEYARRIQLRDASPERDADTIRSRCNTAPPLPNAASNQQWKSELSSAVSLLANAATTLGAATYGELRQLYRNGLTQNSRLRLPPNATEAEKNITFKTAQASCLRVNLTLIELALLHAQEDQDTYSKRFYYDLHRRLRPSTIDSEGMLLSLARRQGVLGVK